MLPRLRRLAIALVGDREAGDRLLQQCLQRVIELPTDADLQIRLYRAVVSASIGQGRSLAALDVPELSRWLRHRTGRSSADQGTMHPPPLEALEEALRLLSHIERAAMLLKDLEGLSYEDAAAVLGTTVEQVKAYHFSARDRLLRLTTKLLE